MLGEEPEDERPITAPDFEVILRGVEGDEESVRHLSELVGLHVRELSRHINLSALDGVTIAGDYDEALVDLDRGVTTTSPLKRSNDDQAVGLAMAPAVIRDGVLKVHIVMHAGLAVGLMDQGSELYQLALHALAHECAHVEVTAKLDAAFPGFVLQHRHSDLHENLRWQIITAEYAAACISAPFGQDPTSEYEATFLTVLASARDNANELIKAYRLHGENGRIMGEVYSCYGDLMKFACYHLGNMAGRDLSLEELPETKAALEGPLVQTTFWAPEGPVRRTSS